MKEIIHTSPPVCEPTTYLDVFLTKDNGLFISRFGRIYTVQSVFEHHTPGRIVSGCRTRESQNLVVWQYSVQMKQLYGHILSYWPNECPHSILITVNLSMVFVVKGSLLYIILKFAVHHRSVRGASRPIWVTSVVGSQRTPSESISFLQNHLLPPAFSSHDWDSGYRFNPLQTDLIQSGFRLVTQCSQCLFRETRWKE